MISAINKYPKLRNVIGTMSNSDAIASVIFLETAVTGGRAYQAYQRDKKSNLDRPVETYERLFEDISSAIVWLGGAWGFNKLGDFLGKKIFGIEKTQFDVGKDHVRTPFKNLLKDNPNFSKGKYSTFKFGKIFASILAATYVVGFVIPKVKRQLAQKHQEKDNKIAGSQALYTQMDGFINDTKTKNNPNFKGLATIDMLNRTCHNIENHPIYRLFATDAGIISGRNISAKDNDERVEITFRDASSIYFYLFSVGHLKHLMYKFDGYANLAKLNLNTALMLNGMLNERLQDDKLGASDFRKKALSDMDVKTFENIKFENEIIKFDELKKIIPEALHAKAEQFAALQPEKADCGKLLTKSQVKDLLTESWLSDADFLTKVYKKQFKNLTNPYAFVPQSQIDQLRSQMTAYVEDIIKYAETSSDKTVSLELLDKINKRGLFRNGIYSTIALGISALFLSTLIPKAQYAITKYRTGEDYFPGLTEKK